MTTEPPKPRTTPLELRLYVVALLAAVYTISWRAIGGHAPAASGATVPATSYVWIDRVPPASRPAVALPSGWQLASEPATTIAPRIVRVPDRPARIRTRSS